MVGKFTFVETVQSVAVMKYIYKYVCILKKTTTIMNSKRKGGVVKCKKKIRLNRNDPQWPDPVIIMDCAMMTRA